MFEFRNGMLGVTIIALAIAGAIVGGYLGGIESVEHDVTKFNFLADVSGLYDYDTNPQYIEYDPSSNYTGYYSTVSEGYWPENSVDFEESQTTNNYKITYKPEILLNNDVQLSTYTQGVVHPINNPHVNFFNTQNGWYSYQPEVVTLKSYIDAMNLSESVTEIEIRSLGTYSDTSSSESVYDANWVSFSTSSMWEDSSGDNDTLWMGSKAWFGENGYQIPHKKVQVGGWTYWYYLPIQSVKLDLRSGYAYLYYDNDCQDYYNSAPISTVYMAYGGEERSGVNTIVYDDTANIIAMHKEYAYLNPNYGVALKED